jgi:hypothetical protein
MPSPAEIAQLEAPVVEFTLNGRQSLRAPRNHHRSGRPRRRGYPAPVLQARHGRRGQLPRLHGRDQWRARAGPPAAAPHARHAGHTDSPRAVHSQKMVLELLQSDMPERSTPATTKWTSGRKKLASASRAFEARGRVGPTCRTRHRRQPRRLHPVHALPARLPRRAGQRRDRPGLPRRGRPRSCSTRTTRWACPPAWPAANACRPARPAR